MKETILNVLRREHREVEDLLRFIDGTDDLARKKELFLELEAKLIPHMEGEERTLYSRLSLEDQQAKFVAGRADHEHHEVKELLARLDQTGIESDEWDSLFRKLRRLIQTHVREEESDLFNEAKEDFSRVELEAMEDEFEHEKHRLAP